MSNTQTGSTKKKSSKAHALLESSKNRLTESKPFQMMVESTYNSMDRTGDGHVSKDELYAGLLLVHLKLAKFAGAAACYPPDKSVCDDLFDAADHDQSGGIDKDEFVAIMGVCCAQILSRMMFYYLILLLFVPYFSANIVDFLWIPNGGYLEMLLETIIGFAMFYIAVPVVWDFVDDLSRDKLEQKDKKKKQQQKTTNNAAAVASSAAPTMNYGEEEEVEGTTNTASHPEDEEDDGEVVEVPEKDGNDKKEM